MLQYRYLLNTTVFKVGTTGQGLNRLNGYKKPIKLYIWTRIKGNANICEKNLLAFLPTVCKQHHFDEECRDREYFSGDIQQIVSAINRFLQPYT